MTSEVARSQAPFLVLDTHHHVLDPVSRAMEQSDTASVNAESGCMDVDVQNRMAYMDTEGMAQAVIIPEPRYLRPNGVADMRRMNDHVAAYRDAAPLRFPAALGVVEPLFGPYGYDELARLQQMGIAGVSFHTRFQGVANDDLWIRRYVERMGALRLVPFVHVVHESVDESLWKLVALARDFPDLPFVALDAFSGFDGPTHVIATANLAPNIMYDTALAFVPEYILEFVRRHGAHRLAFGSDTYSFRALPHLLEWIRLCELPPSDKQKILGDNVRRLLGLPVTPAAGP